MSDQQQFAQKVQELIAQGQALSAEAQQALIELLNAARKRIVAEAADLNPSGFKSQQLQALKRSIDRILEEFRAEAARKVDDIEAQAFQDASDATVAQYGSMGFDVSDLGQISREALIIVQGYTADLITGLSRQASAQINAAIQRAFLGGQSMMDIITQIGSALEGGKFSGLFGPVGDRARMIANNEILRVQSMATQMRMEQMASRHPNMMKKWVHLPAAKVPRRMHIAASGQTVPVKEPFVVAGEELMFPRDPKGSPENTINCHCVSVPFFDMNDYLGAGELLKKYGLSVKVSAA